MSEQNKGATPDHNDKPMHAKGKNYLLAIGINEYEDKRIPRLQNALKDIEKLESILIEKYGFQVHQTLPNVSATRGAIQNALESLEKVLTANDNLIFFFSGHGYRKGRTGYIVPVDGKNNSTTNYITFGDLKDRINEWLEKLGLSKAANRRVETFSGGMKRRVNLIASILHQPKILFYF